MQRMRVDSHVRGTHEVRILKLFGALATAGLTLPAVAAAPDTGSVALRCGALIDGVSAEARGPIFAGIVAVGRAAERPLIAALEDPDAARRRAAVALLARLGDPSTLARLAARIQDEDSSVAAEAREALVAARGTPALPPLVAAWLPNAVFTFASLASLWRLRG